MGYIILEISPHIVKMKKFQSIYEYDYIIEIDNDQATIKEFFNDKKKPRHVFTDIFGKDDFSFIRIFGPQEYIIEDGNLIFKMYKRKVKFMKQNKVHKKLTNRFITLDIETRTINGELIPYCLCYYDGVKEKSFYLSDYKDSTTMLTEAIVSLLRRSYNGYKVYVHNLSGFDGNFLFKILTNIKDFNLKPVMKDGKMINLSLRLNSSGSSYHVDFRDSLLMLPLSLKKLSRAFNLGDEGKGIFPYDFVTSAPLDYTGEVPNIKYFNNLSPEGYSTYSQNYVSEEGRLAIETLKKKLLSIVYRIVMLFTKY